MSPRAAPAFIVPSALEVGATAERWQLRRHTVNPIADGWEPDASRNAPSGSPAGGRTKVDRAPDADYEAALAALEARRGGRRCAIANPTDAAIRKRAGSSSPRLAAATISAAMNSPTPSRGLVARFSQIEGERCLSLIRAFGVVKC